MAGVVPQRMGSEHPNIVPYGSILGCADGREIVIAAATERQFRALAQTLGLAELAEDRRFSSGQARVQNRDKLLQEIRNAAAAIDSADLAKTLTTAKVPFGFVNDMAAVFNQEAAQSMLMRGDSSDAQYTGVRSVAFNIATQPQLSPSPPPHLDQHRHMVLNEVLGLTPEEAESLARDGAFG